MNTYPPYAFHGDFKQLIPYGFQFQKLYARNYRQYSYEKHGDILRVWQHEGGYCETDRWGGYSDLFFKSVLSGDYVRFICSYYTAVCKFIINKKTRELEVSSPSNNIMRLNLQWEKDGLSEAEIDKKINEYYDTYTEVISSLKFIEIVKELAEKGWIRAR